jgi:hypothetical protein
MDALFMLPVRVEPLLLEVPLADVVPHLALPASSSRVIVRGATPKGNIDHETR